MNPKKQKVKERRRARKLAEEAWEAVEAGNLDLAEKIIRRAVLTQIDNPVLWNDQGVLLLRRHKEIEAAEAFRTAIHLAPTFAEPYANLAALRRRQGFTREAVLLQTEAVQHAADNTSYAEQLAAYRALDGENAASPAGPDSVPPSVAVPVLHTQESNPWAGRIAALDWDGLGDQLTRTGCVLLKELLDAPTCAQLRALFTQDELFAKTVVMERPDFGLGTYRYFQAPLPTIVEQLRWSLYPPVARIANSWQRLLREPEHYPPGWESFQEECHRAGQRTPTAILLRYGPGGFNALHRDLRGEVFFPIQLAVILSPRAEPAGPVGDGFQGGEFLLCDVPEGKKSQRRVIPAGLGDAILFCTRDRLVPVGGLYGLQPVKHGVAPITAGERFVLGIPFHEYR